MKVAPFLSVVIPVYNVSSYLRKCVDSVLTQDLDNYEIILVDDGSLDSSTQICDDYASKYSQIRVIHQSNGGLSVARNTGINAARGEYICFIDSDDYWEPNVLGALMNQIKEENLDVLRFNYRKQKIIHEGQYVFEEKNKYIDLFDARTDIVSGEIYLEERMGYNCYAWQYVIKRFLVEKFLPGIYYEDAEWMPRMLLKAQRVNNINLIVYNYLIRPQSITQDISDITKVRKSVEGKMAGIKTFSELSSQYPNLRWLDNMRSANAYYILNAISGLPLSECNDYITNLYAYNCFPISMLNMGGKTKRKIYIINHIGPKIFCILNRFKSLFNRIQSI